MKQLINVVKNYRPPKFVVYFVLLFPLLLCYSNNMKLDNDIWFLLNHGRYVLENGFTHIEPFTIHSNLAFVMQQWLSASIFWIIYKYLGEIGLRLLSVLILFLITVVVHKLCMLISNNKFYLSSIITFIITVSLSILFIVSRPQIFTYLILILELYFLELYIKNNNKKYLYPLPILSLLLINLHASMWFMLFLFMLPYLIDSFKINFGFIKGEGYNNKPLFIVLVIMLAVGFINPYGIDAIMYVFNSYGVKQINLLVGEMKSLNILSFFGKFAYFLIFSVMFVYVFAKKGGLKLRYFLLFCGTVYLSISNCRSFALFIISSIFPLASYLEGYFKVYVDRLSNWPKKMLIQLKVICCIFMILGLVMFMFINAKKVNNNYNPEVYNSANYVLKNYKNDIVLYTGYNDGGYLQFLGYKTYLDPRAEVFLKANNKKSDIFIEYYNLQNNELNGYDFLNKYKFDVLILDRDDVLNKYVNNYKIVYSDNYRSVFENINNKREKN